MNIWAAAASKGIAANASSLTMRPQKPSSLLSQIECKSAKSVGTYLYYSITTSLWIMERMVSALQFIHSHGWLHRCEISNTLCIRKRKSLEVHVYFRDVKPANFCIGDSETHKLYLIDFGMCRYSRVDSRVPLRNFVFSCD